MFTSIVVRACTLQDLKHLCGIEQASFEEDTAYTLEEFQEIHSSQVSKQKALSPGDMIRVAELSIEGGRPFIAGYVYFSKKTKTVNGIRTLNMEIHSMAVEPIYRRMEVGRRLIESIFSLGDFFETKTSKYTLSAFVPETALTAQLFFQAMGFLCTSIEYPKEPDNLDDLADVTTYLFELPRKDQPLTAGRSDASKNR